MVCSNIPLFLFLFIDNSFDLKFEDLHSIPLPEFEFVERGTRFEIYVIF